MINELWYIHKMKYCWTIEKISYWFHETTAKKDSKNSQLRSFHGLENSQHLKYLEWTPKVCITPLYYHVHNDKPQVKEVFDILLLRCREERSTFQKGYHPEKRKLKPIIVKVKFWLIWNSSCIQMNLFRMSVQ